MEKIKVEICCGTACYLLGATRLMGIEQNLSKEMKDRVEFEVKPCLGLCNDERLGGSPYVRINGSEVLANATPDMVISRVNELLGREEV